MHSAIRHSIIIPGIEAISIASDRTFPRHSHDEFGFGVVEQKGSEHRDEMTPEGFKSNHAGGILGGISSGQDIIAHIALKPTSSITIPGKSIDRSGQAIDVITKGRHDPCVGIRATPIAEAMLALTIMDHALRHRGQNADVHCDTPIIKGQAE